MEAGPLGAVGEDAVFVPKVKGRPHLVHRLDARWQGLRTEDLIASIRELATAIDVAGVDYVVGFPEGGLVPAFAFAQVVDRPLILSTRLRLEREPVISFEESHSPQGTTHYLYGLRGGDSVVLVEDEITTGWTVINAVRALRAAGIRASRAAALLAVDTEPLWQRMADEGITLHVRTRVPPDPRGTASAR
jgi:adenine/guanine phosphoribosyltransferase-like PRPP-binding protein